MSDAAHIIAEALRKDGWTCEYHEPVSGPEECSQCDKSHFRTATAILDALKDARADTLERVQALASDWLAAATWEGEPYLVGRAFGAALQEAIDGEPDS